MVFLRFSCFLLVLFSPYGSHLTKQAKQTSKTKSYPESIHICGPFFNAEVFELFRGKIRTTSGRLGIDRKEPMKKKKSLSPYFKNIFGHKMITCYII